MRGTAFSVRMVAAVAVMGLGGCSSAARHPDLPANRGDASWHAVEQPGAAHYALALGEVSSGATAINRVTPTYPPGRLADCPAEVGMTVQLVVDPAGRVTDVRPADAVSGTPDLAPFLDATRAAALQWTFAPLQINHWAADADGNSHVVDSRTLPFSLDYVFRFACHAGEARVSSGNAVAVPTH